MSILEKLRSGIEVDSPAAMEALGLTLVRELFKRGGCVALRGELGAGKTTLVRGMASALGISDVTSPSFNYYFLYKGKVPLLHLDAYRLNAPAEYPSLMVDELLTPRTLFVIEWPEKLGDYLPKKALMLELSIVREGVHRVKAVV